MSVHSYATSLPGHTTHRELEAAHAAEAPDGQLKEELAREVGVVEQHQLRVPLHEREVRVY